MNNFAAQMLSNAAKGKPVINDLKLP